MLKDIFKRKPSVLEVEIDRIVARMHDFDETDEEYTQLMAHLDRLVQLRKDDRSSGIDPNTVAVVGGNLLGILIIVSYERVNVITTRALGFVREIKLR